MPAMPQMRTANSGTLEPESPVLPPVVLVGGGVLPGVGVTTGVGLGVTTGVGVADGDGETLGDGEAQASMVN